MLPQLPNELIDRIIDFLWDDRKTLHNCALTSHVFLPSSRYHLFSHIRVTSRAGLESILNAWRTSYLSLAISSLDLVERPKPEAWVHLVPHVLGELLHKIEALTIRHVNWDETPPSFFLVLPVFTRLKRLALHGCLFTTFYDLQQLLCALPQLEDLTLSEDVRWKYGVPSHLPLLSPPCEAEASDLRITTLGVDGTNVFDAAILQWFVGLALPLWTMELAVSPNAGRLIQRVAMTLEHLTLNICYQVQDVCAGLMQCSNLRTLSLKFLKRANNTALLRDVLFFLCPINRLTRLQLDVSDVLATDLDWKAVNTVLAQARFCSLKELLVVYRWSQPRNKLEAWRKELKAHLSAVCRRGVLLHHRLLSPASPMMPLWRVAPLTARGLQF